MIFKFFGGEAVHRGTVLLGGGGGREQEKSRHLKSNGNSHPLLDYPLIGFFPKKYLTTTLHISFSEPSKQRI